MPSALITGVSRPNAIGWAIADRLASSGWQISTCGWPAHDDEQHLQMDPAITPPHDFHWTAMDFTDAAAPTASIDAHVRRFGALDAVVAAHARSVDQDLGAVTGDELDASFAVNARATILLVQAAARIGVRRVVLFTTGVHQGPMPAEIPYATSKSALQGITSSLAAALAPTGATVNCLNPGPNDTGWADELTKQTVAERMPLAPRWGAPSDVVGLVEFLLSEQGGWITGQTLDCDGGWGIRSGVAPRSL
jgi:3-oxoacyl-[acyl-carrier protein] reductase